jgi:hypothetical protein
LLKPAIADEADWFVAIIGVLGALRYSENRALKDQSKNVGTPSFFFRCRCDRAPYCEGSIYKPYRSACNPALAIGSRARRQAAPGADNSEAARVSKRSGYRYSR